MGIEVQSLRFLLLARELGATFDDVLTIGQQRLMLTSGDAARAFAERGLRIDQETRTHIGHRNAAFAPPLLRAMGAKQVKALDFSAYEGAEVIHDLNHKLDPKLAGQHDFVFDGGTIEHVFNLPEALRSLMSLPRVGGHLALALPSNNEMGHGFYQFSPELFHRLLGPANGYRLKLAAIAPFFQWKSWHLARDPAAVRRRVGHAGTSMPLYCLVLAERVADVAPLQQWPQQADYEEDWKAFDSEGTAAVADTGPRGARALLHRVMPGAVMGAAREVRALVQRPDAAAMPVFDPASSPIDAIAAAFADQAAADSA